MIEATLYFFTDLSFINTAYLGPSLFLVIPPVLTYVTKYQVTSSHTNACLVLDESNYTWQQQWLIRKRAGATGQGGGGTCLYGLPIFGRCISSFSINVGFVPTKMFVIPTTLKSNSENAGAPERKGTVTSPYHFFATRVVHKGRQPSLGVLISDVYRLEGSQKYQRLQFFLKHFPSKIKNSLYHPGKNKTFN